MKKIVALLLVLVMCLSICACNSESGTNTDNTNNNETNSTDTPKSPYADALKGEYDKNPDSIINKSAWLMYSWLTKNINSFKNPASVELTGNAYYAKDEASGEIKYFLIETRADNSFGGKSVGYVKVTATALAETNWEPSIPPRFEGEQVWNHGSSWIANAFNEFIANNYK